MHTPKVSQNLILMHLFCADNSVFVEMHFNYFAIKDLITRKVLVGGKVDRGRYAFDGQAVHKTPTNDTNASQAL